MSYPQACWTNLFGVTWIKKMRKATDLSRTIGAAFLLF